MFKEYKGFDLETLKKGMAVYIDDQDDSYTGNWLVQGVTREKIKLIKYNTMEYELPVENFFPQFDKYAPSARMVLKIIGVNSVV